MGFIVLLGLAAFLIASVSGFFSVWGLAQTYSGIFWFVIAMGASIEYGKLIAISFIYRHWKQAPILLNSYLLIAITAVMVVTAAGHYGFLSSGYQTDSLPLKQVEAQLQSIEEERTRLIDRKTQIDTQISQLPTDYVKGRTQLIRQFKSEQTDTTKRITELDAQVLELKQKKIVSQAHTGPIVFIAQAANTDTDTATHYLTLLLIFVFDPLAIALTWAFNVALRLRQEEQTARQAPVPPIELIIPTEPEKIDVEVVEPDDIEPHQPTELELEPIDEYVSEEVVSLPEPDIEETIEPVEAEETVDSIQPTQSSATPPARRRRPYSGTWDETSNNNIGELITHYKALLKKRDTASSTDTFTNDDLWEMNAIKEAVTKAGLGHYLN